MIPIMLRKLLTHPFSAKVNPLMADNVVSITSFPCSVSITGEDETLMHYTSLERKRLMHHFKLAINI